ncbi:MAG: hypothetical protein LLG14_01255 [Nocardiaceae bacterium]|nr:hypothetical protein [Nocardiaceae bacterium]
MAIVVAFILWALVALPIAIVLGRLCRATPPSAVPADRAVDLREKVRTN